MDLNESKTNPTKELDGVWVKVDDSTELLIARYRNKKHEQYVSKQMEPYRRLQRLGQLDDAITDKVEVDGLARYVLLNWKGLKDAGEEIEYSVQKATELLSDPALGWFSDMVREFSMDLSLFRDEMIEDGADNIKKLSTGG